MKRLNLLLLLSALLLLGSVLVDATQRARTAKVAIEAQHLAMADASLSDVMTARWPHAVLPDELGPRPGPDVPWAKRLQAARTEQAFVAAIGADAPAQVVDSESGPWLVQNVVGGRRRALHWRIVTSHVADRTPGDLVFDGSGHPLRYPIVGPDGPITFRPDPAPGLALATYSDLVRTLLGALAIGFVLFGQARAQAEQQGRRELMQRLSHDLRTPAASVRSLASALRSDAVPDAERATFLELLDHEATRLAGGLDRMLRAARGEPLVVRREPGDLAEWVEQVQLRWLHRVPTLTLDAPASLPWRYDRERLDEAIDALIDNAVKHGGPTVSLSLRQRDGTAELRVQDDGPGVDPTVRKQLFERSVRGDDSAGHGLGLWAAQEVAEAHGGHIALEDPSTFLLTLETP